jgi:phosphoribosylformylglycinamidine synthase
VYVAGITRSELGGSLWSELHGAPGGRVPHPDLGLAPSVFRAVHAAIRRGLLRSCHDASEGGLAVALAEMALAGGLGISASLVPVPCTRMAANDFTLLFSESPTRFLLEVRPEDCAELERILAGVPLGRVGEVTQRGSGGEGSAPRVTIRGLEECVVLDAPVEALKRAWQRPMRWP